MTYDDFVQVMVDRLALEIDPGIALSPSTELFGELGFDSVNAVELLLLIETMADLMVPPVAVPEIYTLSDAYEYLLEARRLAADL